MLYFDTSYLARLYLEDHGFQTVRELAVTDSIATARHGRLETVAAFHRALREGRLSSNEFHQLENQFIFDCERGGIHILANTGATYLKTENAFSHAPASTFLRAADALHLACATENGFTEIYSNDRHFLTAAPLFSLNGVNVIPIA